MKIGFISDIHADFRALQIALDILQGQHVHQVICCGDLVDKGTRGDAVVRLLRERCIPCVMGNHDALARADQQRLHRIYQTSHPLFLTSETLDYLDSLPATLSFQWENKTLLIAHGTPLSDDEYLFPYSPRAAFEAVADSSEADIVVLGHTHEPMLASVGEKWIFNPGSVCGRQGHGSETCATLSLPDLSFRVFDIASANQVQPAYIEYK